MLFAQKYEPLLEERKTWDVFYWKSDSFLRTQGGNQFFVEGDTVYNNISYKILRVRTYYSLGSIPGLFLPPYGVNKISTITGFIREDTLKKQVFYQDLPTQPNPPEVLLYDFSLEEGDSIILQDFIAFPAIVDSIRITLDATGTPRRIFYFSWHTATSYLFYIEGLGGNGGLLSPLCYCFEQGADMMCIKKEYETLWNIDGGTNCNILLYAKNEFLDSKMNFYPNPTTNTLFIEGLENFTGIVTLYDNVGRTIFSKAFENNFETLQVDLNDIPKGIYFCKIQSEQGSITKKIIKN